MDTKAVRDLFPGVIMRKQNSAVKGDWISIEMEAETLNESEKRSFRRYN